MVLSCSNRLVWYWFKACTTNGEDAYKSRTKSYQKRSGCKEDFRRFHLHIVTLSEGFIRIPYPSLWYTEWSAVWGWYVIKIQSRRSCGLATMGKYSQNQELLTSSLFPLSSLACTRLHVRLITFAERRLCFLFSLFSCIVCSFMCLQVFHLKIWFLFD